MDYMMSYFGSPFQNIVIYCLCFFLKIKILYYILY